MDKRLSDFDKVMSCLLEPLGDYAPKRRYLLLDYNDSSGADLHHEARLYVPRGVTDRDLVRLFWEDLARQGYRLSSICEPQEDGGIAILYAAPGLLCLLPALVVVAQAGAVHRVRLLAAGGVIQRSQ